MATDGVMDELDIKIFPIGFFDIGGKRFDWVLENKPVFVDFTRTEMKKCTGFWAIWKKYCENKKTDK